MTRHCGSPGVTTTPDWFVIPVPSLEYISSPTFGQPQADVGIKVLLRRFVVHSKHARIMKSVSSILVLGLGATGALAANFVGSCDAHSVKVSGRTLTANCKNIFGQLKCSKLDLTRCLKNVYGRLQADPDATG